jgi:hypothetical protein
MAGEGRRKEKEKEWTCGSRWFSQKKNRGDEQTGRKETKKITEPGEKQNQGA